MRYIPLNNYWSKNRTDHLTTATGGGRRSAREANYAFVRTEGWAASTRSDEFIVPLALFWHPSRQDNLLTSADGEYRKFLDRIGYQFVRAECWALPSTQEQPGFTLSVPLTVWHSFERMDSLTGGPLSAGDAERTDYVFSGDLGELPSMLGANERPTYLAVFWDDEPDLSGKARQDNLTAATRATFEGAAREGYVYDDELDSIAVDLAPSSRTNGGATVPLQLWWNAKRGDHATVAAAASVSAVKAAGYVHVRDEGRVFLDKAQTPDAFGPAVELRQYYHPVRQDHFLVASPAAEDLARSAGYSFVRTEGFASGWHPKV